MGVPRLLDEPVIGVTQGSGYVEVSTRSRMHRAKDVVVAAGVGSAVIAASAGQRIPLRFGKGYGYDLQVPTLGLSETSRVHSMSGSEPNRSSHEAIVDVLQ